MALTRRASSFISSACSRIRGCSRSDSAELELSKLGVIGGEVIAVRVDLETICTAILEPEQSAAANLERGADEIGAIEWAVVAVGTAARGRVIRNLESRVAAATGPLALGDLSRR